MRLLSVKLLAGAVILAAGSMATLAAPTSGTRAIADQAPASLIEKVHGCHRDPQPGRYGWHYHRGPYCERVAVPAPRHNYGHRHHRGPVCHRKCKYIGPIKVCDDVCR